jgi:hypothetical protein
VLQQCAAWEVPLKLTAGLHHPLPRLDPATGATMHGFINVFVAAVLNRVHELKHDTVVEILNDTEAGHFRFDDDRLAWRELHADRDAVARAREETIVAFGSCSFDEPREDLRALGWL